MSSQKTPHYALHRWSPEDAFLRTEFNDNSTILDAALHSIRQEAISGVSSVQSAVEEAQREAEEAAADAKTEASALVQSAKSELTTALNKAKSDLNAAITAAKKEALNAAAAVEKKVGMVHLADLTLSQDSDSWVIDLTQFDLTPFRAIQLETRLKSEKNHACLRCNNLTSGYRVCFGSSSDTRPFLLILSSVGTGDRLTDSRATLYLDSFALFATGNVAQCHFDPSSSVSSYTLEWGGLDPAVLAPAALTHLTFTGVTSYFDHETGPLLAGSTLRVWGMH